MQSNETPIQPRSTETLGAVLNYEPRELSFGTSGRRGRVVDLTQLEIYICATGEIEYLQSLPTERGGILQGDDFYFACDLRPSSTMFVAEESGRGELAQAIQKAISDAGMNPVYCGPIPTPALANYALGQSKGSMMVTGSHIPFDRNGYKTNTARGELLKEDEGPIARFVSAVRERVLNEPFSTSLFDERGMFKAGHVNLNAVHPGAREGYVRRYLDFFEANSLSGARVLCYQHSAVGRDLLLEILKGLGAEVLPIGRSDKFIPIDTENIDHERLTAIQSLVDEATAGNGCFDAVVSMDGDSDRPLLLGIEAGTQVRFFGGDLIGSVVAEFLKADAVVVPISSNDGIDRGCLAAVLEPKTRIGSPYVISGMAAALSRGRACVCGWEANGGFLTGCEIVRNGRKLRPLPTRDAVLPLLCTLVAAREAGVSICKLFDTLPKRFSRAGLLKEIPRSTSLRLLDAFTCSDPRVLEVDFKSGDTVLIGAEGATIDSASVIGEMGQVRSRLQQFFTSARGFASVSRMNYVDGIRVTFQNEEVAHLRPSGNADELRVYAVADSAERAAAIIQAALAEPDGIIRTMQRTLA